MLLPATSHTLIHVWPLSTLSCYALISPLLLFSAHLHLFSTLARRFTSSLQVWLLILASVFTIFISFASVMKAEASLSLQQMRKRPSHYLGLVGHQSTHPGRQWRVALCWSVLSYKIYWFYNFLFSSFFVVSILLFVCHFAFVFLLSLPFLSWNFKIALMIYF